MTDYHLYVRPDALSRESRVYDEQREDVEQVRADLKAAFDRDRNTLGDDAYGAELAKALPKMEADIFDALQAYIDELDGIAANLRTSAANYEQADDPRI
jgi:hypothetical protein